MKIGRIIFLTGMLAAMATVSATENEGTFVLQPPKEADKSGSSGKIQAQYKVNYVSFKATPKQLNASCPAKVKFTGQIGSTGPGTVKYRVLYPGNAKTAIRTLQFTRAGKKSIGTVIYKATRSFPNAVAILEVVSPQKKKVSTHFKVNCIAASGPNSIGTNPSTARFPKK